MLSSAQRTLAVLKALDLQPASRAASGRYLRSLPVRPGVRYWATSQPRFREDFLGIQFYGEGLAEARRLQDRLLRAGFRRRTPQTGQETFARPVPFSTDETLDAAALRRVRRELDAILADGTRPNGVAEPPRSFRGFMLASPLADMEIALPSRPADWRDEEA